jgi:SAM-dependent methyltransferase
MNHPPMQIRSPAAAREATELEIISATLPLENARVLELGCGRAWMTRRIAEDFAVARLVATEVDRVQHDKNLRIADLPLVEFRYGGAEAIDLPDASIDVVLMLKSLHHVPGPFMAQALGEIRRVLVPGGLAYISEPVYAGAFNDILRLFNDERQVREAAFAAVVDAVESGRFELAAEIFFDAPGHYADWQDFEDRLLKVTHTDHRIDTTLHTRIKAAFESHLGPDGASFLRPSRVDLLRKPAD